MTGKHYNWHKRWAVDLAALTASHDSGLVVRFEAHPDARRAGDNVAEWQARACDEMNALDMANHTRRRLDEAGRAWEWAAGRHVAAYIEKCTAGIKAAPGVWKIKVPAPRDALERWALDAFLSQVKCETGVAPSVETWN